MDLDDEEAADLAGKLRGALRKEIEEMRRGGKL